MFSASEQILTQDSRASWIFNEAERKTNPKFSCFHLFRSHSCSVQVSVWAPSLWELPGCSTSQSAEAVSWFRYLSSEGGESCCWFFNYKLQMTSILFIFSVRQGKLDKEVLKWWWFIRNEGREWFCRFRSLIFHSFCLLKSNPQRWLGNILW